MALPLSPNGNVQQVSDVHDHVRWHLVYTLLLVVEGCAVSSRLDEQLAGSLPDRAARAKSEQPDRYPRLDLHPESCGLSEEGAAELTVVLRNPHREAVGIVFGGERQKFPARAISELDELFSWPEKDDHAGVPRAYVVIGSSDCGPPPPPRLHAVAPGNRSERTVPIAASLEESLYSFLWTQFLPSEPERFWPAQICWRLRFEILDGQCSLAGRQQVSCNVPGAVEVRVN